MVFQTHFYYFLHTGNHQVTGFYTLQHFISMSRLNPPFPALPSICLSFTAGALWVLSELSTFIFLFLNPLKLIFQCSLELLWDYTTSLIYSLPPKENYNSPTLYPSFNPLPHLVYFYLASFNHYHLYHTHCE